MIILTLLLAFTVILLIAMKCAPMDPDELDDLRSHSGPYALPDLNEELDNKIDAVLSDKEKVEMREWIDEIHDELNNPIT
jgi:hypothetical protein